MFTGVTATQHLLERQALDVRSLRESGINVELNVALVISAMISALLKAKHDFPLRLAGQSWGQILQNRVVKELLVGMCLVGIVILFERPEALWIAIVVAVYGLFVVPLSHIFTTRWCFNGKYKCE